MRCGAGENNLNSSSSEGNNNPKSHREGRVQGLGVGYIERGLEWKGGANGASEQFLEQSKQIQKQKKSAK